MTLLVMMSAICNVVAIFTRINCPFLMAMCGMCLLLKYDIGESVGHNNHQDCVSTLYIKSLTECPGEGRAYVIH